MDNPSKTGLSSKELKAYLNELINNLSEEELRTIQIIIEDPVEAEVKVEETFVSDKKVVVHSARWPKNYSNLLGTMGVGMTLTFYDDDTARGKGNCKSTWPSGTKFHAGHKIDQNTRLGIELGYHPYEVSGTLDSTGSLTYLPDKPITRWMTVG